MLAVVAVVALEAQRRARELAFLRTLGLSEGQAIALAFVEHAPPALLALGIGILLGLGLAWLLEPGLGLAAFIDPGTPVQLQVEWTAVVGDGPGDADGRRDPGPAERVAGPSTRPGPGPSDRRMNHQMTTEAP